MIRIRTHGPWCRLRSFTTNCPGCNEQVFYWECTHGSKVFFNLPLRKPLIRHRCGVKRNTKSISKVKDEGYVFKVIYNCPVCGKPFKKELDLKNHLKGKRYQDDEHQVYYEIEILRKI